jgi:hypothetical protein
MGFLEPWVQRLTLLYAVAEAGLLVRLVVERLHRRYRFFALFLAIDLCFAVLFLFTPYGTILYFRLWVVGVVVLAVCHFMVVLELYGLVLRDYPGIRGLFRWLVRVLVPAAALISLVPAAVSLDAGAVPPDRALALALVMARTALLGVLISLLVLEFILFWCPLTLSRNTAIYCAGYLVFFTAPAAALIVAGQFGARATPLVNVIMQSLSCACLLFWAVTLSRKGEQRQTIARAYWLAGEKERVRELLSSFDGFLSHLVKRGRE